MSTETRAIYEAGAKEHVRDALRKAPPNVLSSRDAVASAEIASQIHAAVTSAVFGRSHIEQQRPYIPVRIGEFWVVYGSLPQQSLGGTAVTVIRASNGEVLRIVHEQ